MIQSAKKEVFGHYPEFALLNRLDIAYCDSTKGCRSQIWNEAVRNMVISIKVSTDVSLVAMVMHERQGIIANFSHQLHVTSHVEISSKVAANCFVRPNS